MQQCYIAVGCFIFDNLEVYQFSLAPFCKVDTEDSKVPTNKDFEWWRKAAPVEISFLIDVWEEGPHKVPQMCWMERCSGQRLFLSLLLSILLSQPLAYGPC